MPTTIFFFAAELKFKYFEERITKRHNQNEPSYRFSNPLPPQRPIQTKNYERSLLGITAKWEGSPLGKSNLAIISTLTEGLLIALASNCSSGENVTTISGSGRGKCSSSERILYLPALVNGGEVAPGGTSTGGMGMTPWVMMTAMCPLFLTWKLAM